MPKRPLWANHLISVLIAPATMTVFIPAVILAFTGVALPDPGTATGLLLILTGAVLIAIGLGFLTWTVWLFDRVGEGALAVGTPVNLVVRGPYRHVRNPMMTAVFCLQLGTAAVTASPWLLGWFAVFCTAVLISIPIFEEPHLVKRFGAEYQTYRHHVPRWIPRVTAWVPVQQQAVPTA
ncbi:methyltransferase family protein [[Mycobacterium] nativiensis]|uniref:Isoprenylcysteine carboxylmethyltransferase family protein n=1 Tax=[Mycobacterium] nativiensis TaxID=2855503 RepID=A0ABU5XXZ4_9MYCO|nr:isoprenylcysteine carboxylmethyltransferase family protein [Mycolicibacter sp. MYC340]MEB3032837.1 isoprenylcysteine carboxylmethyltransferase family protein [Mycolicibacter sp. MYC340]